MVTIKNWLAMVWSFFLVISAVVAAISLVMAVGQLETYLIDKLNNRYSRRILRPDQAA